jgi:hypothetical protein
MSGFELSLRERREQLSAQFRKKEHDLFFRKSRLKHKTLPFERKMPSGNLIEAEPLMESMREWIVWLNCDEEWAESKVNGMREFLKENIGVLDKLKNESRFQEISGEMSFELVIKKLISSMGDCPYIDRVWQICATLTGVFTCRVSLPTYLALFRIVEMPFLPNKDMDNIFIMIINFYRDSPETLDPLLFTEEPWDCLHAKIRHCLDQQNHAALPSILDSLNLLMFSVFVKQADTEKSASLLEKFQILTVTVWSAIPVAPNPLQIYSFFVWALYARLLSDPSYFLTPFTCEDIINYLKINSLNLEAADLLFSFVDLLSDYLNPETVRAILYPHLQFILRFVKKVLTHKILTLRDNGLQVLSNMFTISYDVYLIEAVQAEGIAQLTIEAFRGSTDHSFELICLRFLGNYIKGLRLEESGGSDPNIREDLDLFDALFDKLRFAKSLPTNLVLGYLELVQCILERGLELAYWKPNEQNEVIRFATSNLHYIHSLETLFQDERQEVWQKAEFIFEQFLSDATNGNAFAYFNND